MYYYNNKQVQNPHCDWSCEKNQVTKVTRFCILCVSGVMQAVIFFNKTS